MESLKDLEHQHVDESSDESDVDDGSVSSESDPTGSRATNTSRDDAKKREKELRDQIIKGEEKGVRATRRVVFVAVIVSAVAVTVAIYFFAKEGDKTNFQLEFDAYSVEMIRLMQWEVQYNFALMQQFSAAITAGALMTGGVFPHFTLPSFEVGAGYVDGMGGIMLAAYSPLITGDQVGEWEEYASLNKNWTEESARLKKAHPSHRDPLHGTIQDHEHRRHLQDDSYNEQLYRWEDGTRIREIPLPGQVVAPLWQVSPASVSAINTNLLSDERIKLLYDEMLVDNHSLLSDPTPIGDLFDFQFDPEEKDFKALPHSFLVEAVYDAFEEPKKIVGFLTGLTAWENLMNFILAEGKNGVICVFTSTCGHVMSWEVNGPRSTYLGEGDFHDPTYNDYAHSSTLEVDYDRLKGEDICVHSVDLYPSALFESAYDTNKPFIYTAVVALAFLLTLVFLIVYDKMVTRRQEKTMKQFIKSQNFISSLFPDNVRERIIDGDDVGNASKKGGSGLEQSRPIADFFPHTTIMFADITGFTAWSSTREPHQVFELLETFYGAFDKVAKRRGIFKVETVGDCYVAVAGLPLPRKDHAVAMVRFARDCLTQINDLSHQMEVSLGPDTADLSFRVGLHSGAVTGGVLRGENSRFQLFGDTMNTAARMESTGSKDRIQCSKATADLLREAGKDNWLTARTNTVEIKGKGDMETYWVISGRERSNSVGTDSTGRDTDETVEPGVSPETGIQLNQKTLSMASHKMTRLVKWNADSLLKVLKDIVNRRIRDGRAVSRTVRRETDFVNPSRQVIDEVQEVIMLPKKKTEVTDANTADKESNSEEIELDEAVVEQMNEYIGSIAATYRENPFHSFEHASHVAMSVNKLLSRIVTPKDESVAKADVHGDSYGITADPLTQFACIFSAVIHDADHTGLPNAQLIKENTALARYYQGKSVAEQNSVDLAWALLMEDKYKELRQAIYSNDDELRRFRQLVVNAVMATDIIDKGLKKLRNDRWEKAFSEGGQHNESERVNVNRKATIVIEHLIQASDVSHTMQHWHIYRKWNENFFMESYKAYAQGRADKDPSDTWYKGEIGFFDFYIIPLAKKLKDCNVFGVSSDEYLNYALSNRREWERRGQEVVAEMIAKAKLINWTDEEASENHDATPLASYLTESVRTAAPQAVRNEAAVRRVLAVATTPPASPSKVRRFL